METTRSKPSYHTEFTITSVHDDDLDSTFKVCRYGKAFCVDVSPANFVNSPTITSTYMSYIPLLKSGEEEADDIYVDDVYDWIMRPCETAFTQLAPRPAAVAANVTVTVMDWLYPDYFSLKLVATDDKLSARHVETKKDPFLPPGQHLEPGFFADLGTWTTVYDAATVVLSFDDPQDAFFKPPSRVLIDGGRTACFFKPCISYRTTMKELEMYRKILSANLDRHLSLCHFFGVVVNPSRSTVVGLLLTYIDRDQDHDIGSMDIQGPTDREKRMRWMEKLEATLRGLHGVGAVWGDVKADNVMLDRRGKVWMIDFGGGHTEGWLDGQLAGTVEGDWVGMAKLRAHMLGEGGG